MLKWRGSARVEQPMEGLNFHSCASDFVFKLFICLELCFFQFKFSFHCLSQLCFFHSLINIWSCFFIPLLFYAIPTRLLQLVFFSQHTPSPFRCLSYRVPHSGLLQQDEPAPGHNVTVLRALTLLSEFLFFLSITCSWLMILCAQLISSRLFNRAVVMRSLVNRVECSEVGS